MRIVNAIIETQQAILDERYQNFVPLPVNQLS